MELEQEILINKYGQNIISIEIIKDEFTKLDVANKKKYLQHLVFLIIQSKSVDSDIKQAVENSLLKSTFTPCILLDKDGVKYYNLQKIIDLPIDEWDKVLILLLNIFKIAYYRRFQEEKNNPDKWWYWDLSFKKNVMNLLKLQNQK